MKKLFIAAALLLIAVNCQQKGDNADFSKNTLSFQLSDGSTISQDGVDDYNPVLLQKSNGILVLFFGSNRSCAGCSNHNLFVSTSTNAYSYGTFPKFNQPVVVQISGSTLNKTERISYGVYLDGSEQGKVYYTDTASDIKVGVIPDFSTGAMNTPNSISTTGKVTSVLSSGGSVDLVYKTSGGATVKNIVPGNPDVTISNSDLNDNAHIALLPSYVTYGSSPGYFFTNWPEDGSYGGYLLGGIESYTEGEVLDFNEAVIGAGLGVSYSAPFVSIYDGLSALTFSAGETLNGDQDLYIVTSHTLEDMWYLLVPTGLIFDFAGFGTITVNVTGAGAATDLWAGTTMMEVPGYFGEKVQLTNMGGGNFSGDLLVDQADPTPRNIVIWDDIDTGRRPWGGTQVFAGAAQMAGLYTAQGNDYFSPCQGGRVSPSNPIANFVFTNSATSFTVSSAPSIIFPPRLSGANSSNIVAPSQFPSTEKFTISASHYADDIVNVAYSTLRTTSGWNNFANLCECQKTLNVKDASGTGTVGKIMHLTDTNANATVSTPGSSTYLVNASGGSCGARFYF